MGHLGNNVAALFAVLPSLFGDREESVLILKWLWSLADGLL